SSTQRSSTSPSTIPPASSPWRTPASSRPIRVSSARATSSPSTRFWRAPAGPVPKPARTTSGCGPTSPSIRCCCAFSRGASGGAGELRQFLGAVGMPRRPPAHPHPPLRSPTRTAPALRGDHLRAAEPATHGEPAAPQADPALHPAHPGLPLRAPGARPPESAAAAQTRGPAATAIVLDTSLSMRTRADGTPIFEAAIEEARRALADLRPEEPATLVTCGGQEALPGPPDFDRAGMRTRLDGLEEAGYLHADLNRCLDAAARALEESPLPGRRLVVISDFAAHGLRLEAPPPVVSDGEGGHIQPEVVLRPVGSDPAPGNAAVTRVQVAPATQAGPGTF